MSAAPVHDSQAEMSDRGTAPNAHAPGTAETSEMRPVSGAGDATSQGTESNNAGKQSVSEKGKEAVSEAKETSADESSKDSSGDKEDKEDGEGGDDKKKGSKDDDPKELTPAQKEELKKYAIHSELQEKLSAEIEKKPEKDWGVTNPAREADEEEEAGEKGEGKETAKAPKSGMPDDKSTTPAEHKESMGDKVKHMLHKK